MAEGNKKFKITVKMKEPWVNVDSWIEKPASDKVMERFIEELENGNMENLFEVTVEEVKEKGSLNEH